MKNNIFYVICGFIVLVLVGILIIALSVKPVYTTISYEDIESKKTGLIYFGKLDSDKKNEIKTFVNSNDIEVFNVVNYELDKVNEKIDEANLVHLNSDGYVLYYDSKVVWAGTYLDNYDLKLVIKTIVNGDIEIETLYTNVDKVSELIDKVNSKDYTVVVLGKDDCNYCTQFKPILNNIVKNNNIDIYYLNKSLVGESDFNKFKNLELDVPEKCSNHNESGTTKTVSLSYPLTFITKNGKSVDCVLGYQSEANLVALLQDYNIIK